MPSYTAAGAAFLRPSRGPTPKGAKDAVMREIAKDAQMKGKTLEETEFAGDVSYCDAEIDSRAPLTREECDWFRKRWDITRPGHAPCRPDVRPSD